MDEASFQLARGGAFAVSLALVYVAQGLWPCRAATWRVRPNWRSNLALAVLNAVLVALVCGGCLCTAARWAEVRGIGLLRRADVGAAAGLALSFLALDLTLWAWHRANHAVPWLWRFHQVHHADSVFDVTTSLRFHAGELLLSLPVKAAVVILLGTSVAGVLLFETVFGLFNMIVHADLRLPARAEAAIERVLVPPVAHRLHHVAVAAAPRGNFGTVLSWWDRLAGTWQPARSGDAIAAGLDAVPATTAFSVRALLAMPFRALAGPDVPHLERGSGLR